MPSWPGKISPGTTSKETICLTDLFATTAALLNEDLPEDAGEDNYNILSALLGEDYDDPIREATVHHSVDGSFAIRKGDWKLAICPGSGGWSLSPERAMMENMPMLQLYNIDKDRGEKNNVYAKYPDIANRMIRLLEKYVDEGRSTPGIPQKNDVYPDIWRAMKVRNTIFDTTSVNHMGVGAKVSLISDVEVKYSKDGPSGLTDGIRASSAHDDGYWVGVEEKDIELLIDLKNEQMIKEIKLGLLQNQNYWIFLPERIEFSVSTNGQAFTELRHIAPEAREQNNKKTIRDIALNDINLKVRYIKIKVVNIGICPEWHKGAGGKAWVFLDEVIIR